MRVLRGNDILINWSVFYDAGGVKTNVDFSNSTLSVFILDSYGKRAVEHTVSGNVISIHYGGEIQRLGTVAIDAYWQNNNTLVWSRAKKNEVVELVDNPESVTLDGVPTDISITTINTSSDTFFGGTYNANFSNYYTKEEIDNKIISDYNFLSNKPLVYDEETGKYTAIDAPINFVNNINIGNFVAGVSGINFAADGSGEIGTLNVRDRLIVNGVEITGSGTGGIDVTNMWNVLGSADDSDKQINIVHLTDALSGYLQTSTFDDLFEKVNIGTLAAPKYAIKAKYDFYSIGEVSAFGAGSGGSSGGGLIQTVYGYSSLGNTFNNATLTDTFNAYTINQLHARLSQVEVGAAINVSVSGTGNAITGVTKNNGALEFTKGLNFSLENHTHDYIPLSQKGTANGVASLDANGLIISAQLPSYVDDVIEVSAYANLPVSGESGKIYVTTDTNITYRWTGTTYVEISKSIALGETSSTAYRGDLGAIAYAHSQIAGGTGVHVSATERTNWNTAYTNSHTHANKSILDAFNQSDNDVLDHLSVVDGKLKADIDFYSTGEVSAFGASSGTGGSGLIQTVYGLSGLGGTYSDATLTDTFNAYTINSLHNRINSLEAGSVLNFTTIGSGNAVTSVTKSGNAITVNKGLTFSIDGHTHPFSSLTNIPTTLSGYGITDAIKNNGLTESYVPRYTSSGFVNSKIYDTGTDVIIGGSTNAHFTNSALNLERIDSNISRLALTNRYESTESSAIITLVTRDIIAGVTVLSGRIAAVSRVTTGNAPGLSISGNPKLYLTSSEFVNISVNTVEKININTTNILVKAPIVSTYDIAAPTFTGALIGNADSATKLQTARTIAGVSFDGTSNISIPFTNLSSIPTTINGYGITDAYTKTQIDGFLALKLDVATFNDLFEKVNIGTELSPVYAIKAKYNFYSVGEVSAFGAGAGSGGSGLIQTVYGYSGLGGTYSDTTLTDTFNAYTINKINIDLGARITSLESGSALTFSTAGSGNAVTSVTKSGTSVTITKGLTFSVDGHTHTFDSLTSKPSTLGGYGITDALLASSYTAADVLAKIKTVDGDGSGLDADLLDGLHGNEYLRKYPSGVGASLDLNNCSGVNIHSGYNITNSPYVGDVSILTIPLWNGGGKYSTQFVFGINPAVNPYFRRTDVNGGGGWRQLAFLDDNVASATRLQTTRSIWGQNFDGTGNVSGALSNATTGSFSSHVKIGGGTVNLGGLWDGGLIAGADGHDKVVASYLSSSTNAATIGAHNSALYNWAKLNIAGTSIQFSIGETPKMNLDNGGNLVLSGHLGVSSAGKVASFGVNSNAPSTAIANQNTFIQLVTSGATNSMGLIFHNSGVSTSALEYVNADSNNGYFNFKSDNTSWELKVNGNKVWHAGNDGSGSGLDADTLDGVHYSNMWGFSTPTNYDLNNLTSSYINSWNYDYATSASVLNQPLGNNVSDARGVLSIHNGYRLQLSWRYIDPSSMYVRSFYNGNWYEWKQFAFVTSNVASATKLQTGRYIFGQYFDGTSDVNGDCIINHSAADAGIRINNDSDTYSRIRFYDTSGNFATIHAFSQGSFLYNGEKSINIDAAGAVTFGGWSDPILYVQRASKRVGINTTNPQSALDIGSGSLTLRSFTNRAVNTGEAFEIGYSEGGVLQSFDRTTFTYKLINYNASQHIFNVGNVLIGSTTDLGYKLNVAGNGFFGGTLGTTSTLSVKGTTAFDSMARLNITNGSADYGRAQLRITGRLQDSNDAWSISSGRNNIIFGVNANNSNVGIGEDGVDKMAIQYQMVTNQLGIVSESSPNSPIVSISQNGDAAFNGAVAANRFYAGYDSGQANSISCSNWFLSNGATGWYNATYGGGITMIDSTYVRVFNNKAFWVDNNIVATGEITAFGASDIRLKSNIKPINSALDFLGKVKTYEFDWNEKAISLNPLKTKRGAGVIAQEMNLLDNNFVHSIYGDYLGVDYERFIPYLIGGVNETNKKLVTIGKRLDNVDSEIDKLKYKILELENKLMEYERN